MADLLAAAHNATGLFAACIDERGSEIAALKRFTTPTESISAPEAVRSLGLANAGAPPDPPATKLPAPAPPWGQGYEIEVTLPDGDDSLRTILIDGRAVHPKGAHTVAPGQRFTMRDAGGGGFGAPANRPSAKVLADVAEGLVSPGVAREVYGVEVTSGYRA